MIRGSVYGRNHPKVKRWRGHSWEMMVEMISIHDRNMFFSLPAVTVLWHVCMYSVQVTCFREIDRCKNHLVHGKFILDSSAETLDGKRMELVCKHLIWLNNSPTWKLVGGILTYPSEKWWSSSVMMIIPNIWKVIKAMFQTTNQIAIYNHRAIWEWFPNDITRSQVTTSSRSREMVIMLWYAWFLSTLTLDTLVRYWYPDLMINWTNYIRISVYMIYIISLMIPSFEVAKLGTFCFFTPPFAPPSPPSTSEADGEATCSESWTGSEGEPCIKFWAN